MGFFDDDNDPFEDIISEFFSDKPRTSRRVYSNGEEFIHGEEEDRVIDFVEDDNKIYVVFELSGYDEKDVKVEIDGKQLVILASKKKCDADKIQNYLSQKLCRGIKIQKNLPKFVETKNFKYQIKNGVLEVVFNKK